MAAGGLVVNVKCPGGNGVRSAAFSLEHSVTFDEVIRRVASAFAIGDDEPFRLFSNELSSHVDSMEALAQAASGAVFVRFIRPRRPASAASAFDTAASASDAAVACRVASAQAAVAAPTAPQSVFAARTRLHVHASPNELRAGIAGAAFVMPAGATLAQALDRACAKLLPADAPTAGLCFVGADGRPIADAAALQYDAHLALAPVSMAEPAGAWAATSETATAPATAPATATTAEGAAEAAEAAACGDELDDMQGLFAALLDVGARGSAPSFLLDDSQTLDAALARALHESEVQRAAALDAQEAADWALAQRLSQSPRAAAAATEEFCKDVDADDWAAAHAEALAFEGAVGEARQAAQDATAAAAAAAAQAQAQAQESADLALARSLANETPAHASQASLDLWLAERLSRVEARLQRRAAAQIASAAASGGGRGRLLGASDYDDDDGTNNDDGRQARRLQRIGVPVASVLGGAGHIDSELWALVRPVLGKLRLDGARVVCVAQRRLQDAFAAQCAEFAAQYTDRYYHARVFVGFHGTGEQNVRSISAQGLVVPGERTGAGRRIAVHNGSVYGRGIYLSPSLSFAAGYAPEGTVLVCALVLGRAAQTGPVQERISQADSHISLDRLQYVLFSPRQVCPLFVLVLPRGGDLGAAEGFVAPRPDP